MPYIDQDARKLLDDHGRVPLKPGELNYKLSQIVRSYIAMRGKSYTIYNDVIGVLECLKLELYRRQIGQYEDAKMSENGDVW